MDNLLPLRLALRPLVASYRPNFGQKKYPSSRGKR